MADHICILKRYDDRRICEVCGKMMKDPFPWYQRVWWFLTDDLTLLFVVGAACWVGAGLCFYWAFTP